MNVADFDYSLPQELIAQHPARERASSRLLHLDAGGRIADLTFSDLPSLVGPDDAVVLNDTRVIKARLHGAKPSGGKVQIMVERIVAEHEALALMRAGHSPKPGTIVNVGDARAEVIGREEDLYRVRFSEPVAALLERFGQVPLPPYITHAPGPEDLGRYQTVYAREPGAVAAPTAGLHFDDEMLKALSGKIQKITLHVGAGTFQPVREETIEQHRMHRERYSVPPETMKAIAGKRVLAVGTTSLRALEAAAGGKLQGETDLFIYPGYRFRVVQRLLTNFHLPKSTLLMLVAAFAGLGNVKKAYAHAIERRYRFFSYGDAMLIERAK
jgi:S-adenosylmethionine:tRNA ribosyltransferase-isomerase